jgi:hypothetical protein
MRNTEDNYYKFGRGLKSYGGKLKSPKSTGTSEFKDS